LIPTWNSQIFLTSSLTHYHETIVQMYGLFFQLDGNTNMILISSRCSFRGFQDEWVLTLYFSFWGIFIELTSQLEKERSEINRLENEKKDWLSRGVHAEFEKKDKVHNIIINICPETTFNLFFYSSRS